MVAVESLSGCGELVVLFSIIVVTFVLCDEICVVVFNPVNWIQSDSKSEKSNPQQDPVLETGPQKPQKPERTNIMTLSHQNVLAHTMTLVPHARHGKSLERALTSYRCQDALKCWLAETECVESKDECWEVEFECGRASEVQDDCPCWEVVDAFPRSCPTCSHIYVVKSKEITPADIMARWNLI